MKFIRTDVDNLSSLEAYKLLISAIVPRPIALVTTVDQEGNINGAPFSFFQGITSKPPLIMLSVGRNKGRPKDTVANIEKTGEFVINGVSEEIIQQVVQTSAEYPPGVNELEEAGLHWLDSDLVRPPRVLESPLHLECKLYEIIQLGRSLQFLILGEVLCYHLREDVRQNNHTVDPRKFKPVGRLGDSNYCSLSEIFEIPRPKKPVAKSEKPE